MTKMRGGAEATDPRLGRVPFLDPRSRAFPIRTLLDAELPGPAQPYSWRYVPLDQTWDNPADPNDAGGCTGFGTTQEAAARPVPVFGDPVNAPPDATETEGIHRIGRQVYYRARELDPWPGEAYAGSAGIAAVKAAVERGWYGDREDVDYRWALGPGPERAADDVCRSVRRGPVMLGTWWRSGMWRHDGTGHLRYHGDYEGGHWFLVTAYSAKLDAVWTPNTWSQQVSDPHDPRTFTEGQGWITRADLVAALAEDGEACVIVRRTK